MKVNVYFSTALMSTISASVIAKKMHPSDVNVLCIERANNHFHEGYYDLNRIIETFFKWDKVFYVDRDERAWPARQNLFKHAAAVFKINEYYKSFRKRINDNIAEFGKVDKIYVSYPSRLWCLVKQRGVKINVIEHGVNEYNLLYTMNSGGGVVNKCKSVLDMMMGYRHLIRVVPTRFVLLDGGRCHLLKKIKTVKVPFISIEAKELITELALYFEREYQKKFPNEYEEIQIIKNKMSKFENRYIYLPTTEVCPNEYNQYVDCQLKDIKLENTCVLIKDHPQYHGDYADSFDNRCQVYNFKHKLNSMLPVEVLMVMLNMPTLWGSYSSALIYSYWWHGTVPVLSTVVSNKANAILLREYNHFIESDFCKFERNSLTNQ